MRKKISIVLFKDKTLETATTIDVDNVDVISRRLSQIQYDGFDECLIVYDAIATWSVTFPLTQIEIEKLATKLFHNL